MNLIEHVEYKQRAEKMKLQLLKSMRRTADPQLANLETLLRGEQPIVVQPAKLKSHQFRAQLSIRLNQDSRSDDA